MKFCHFFLFVLFVVLTVDQLVERGDGLFELQKQDSQESKKLRIGNGIFDMGWVG